MSNHRSHEKLDSKPSSRDGIPQSQPGLVFLEEVPHNSQADEADGRSRSRHEPPPRTSAKLALGHATPAKKRAVLTQVKTRVITVGLNPLPSQTTLFAAEPAVARRYLRRSPFDRSPSGHHRDRRVGSARPCLQDALAPSPAASPGCPRLHWSGSRTTGTAMPERCGPSGTLVTCRLV